MPVREGGRYIADPVTGEVTRVDDTAMPPLPTPPDKPAAEPRTEGARARKGS